MSTHQPCVIEVPSTPPRPDEPGGDLPAAGGGSLELLLLGLLLVAAGVAIARRRRRGAARAIPLAAVLAFGLATAWSIASPTPVQAAPAAETCSLIEIDGIVRDTGADDLLPGDEAEALRYTIRNITDVPVSLTVATDVDGSPLAQALTAVLSGDPGGRLGEAPLDELPVSERLVLDGGQHLEVSYRVQLGLASGNDLQDTTAVFDSIVTATGP